MGDLLRVEGLRVEYEDVTAVDDVSFSIERGMVYGLIGPNGAGKTSIIRAVAGLIEPTWGKISLSNVDLIDDTRRALGNIGYMPDFPPLYDDLTVREFMELFASAYNLAPSLRRSRIDDLVAMVQLTEKMDQLAGGLSRGMKQRLFLAKTLLHDPDLLLLDEPASGLDPRARLELRDIIVELGKQGKGVLVSSHILSEMADFCNSVGIMEQGKMIVTGRIDDILRQVQPGRNLLIRLLKPDDRLKGLLETWAGVTRVVVEEAHAEVKLQGEEADVVHLLKTLIEQGFPVVEFREQSGNLQDLFLHVSKGRVS